MYHCVHLIDGDYENFDFFGLRPNVALKFSPDGDYNRNLTVPKPCRFLHPNFRVRKLTQETSLNSDVSFNCKFSKLLS